MNVNIHARSHFAYGKQIQEKDQLYKQLVHCITDPVVNCFRILVKGEVQQKQRPMEEDIRVWDRG